MKEIVVNVPEREVPWDTMVTALWLPLAMGAVTGHTIAESVKQILLGRVEIDGIPTRDVDMAVGAGVHTLMLYGTQFDFGSVPVKVDPSIDDHGIDKLLAGNTLEFPMARVSLDVENRVLNVCVHKLDMSRSPGTLNAPEGKLYTSCLQDLD